MKIIKNILALSFIILTATSFAACKSGSSPSADSTLLTKTLKDKETFIVDVRTPDEFAEGAIEGAINIPVNQVEEQIEQFKNKKQIVVYCRRGGRAATAKNILEKHGISNVINARGYDDLKATLSAKK